MSANLFPAILDPFKWAEQGFVWAGEVPLSRFSRLTQDLADTNQQLNLSCRLSVDERKIAWLDAEISGEVALTCQRCLQPTETMVDCTMHIALLPDDYKIERLSELEDFVLLNESEAAKGDYTHYDVDLLAIIEDEVLLSLPLAPKHENCEVTNPKYVQQEEQEQRHNPFAALASLKSKE